MSDLFVAYLEVKDITHESDVDPAAQKVARLLVSAFESGAMALIFHTGRKALPDRYKNGDLKKDAEAFWKDEGGNLSLPGDGGRKAALEAAERAKRKATRAEIISMAEDALEPLTKQFPDAEVGFRGSLARGTKGKHKGGGPFDPTDYDVDAFIVSDDLAGKIPKDAKGFRNLGRLPQNQSLTKSISDKLRKISGHRNAPVKIRVFTKAEFNKLTIDEVHLLQ